MRTMAVLAGTMMIGGYVAAAAHGKDAALNGSTWLWYDTPATEFCQGLPLGNGRLGITVFGGPGEERIVLNEESVWSGSTFANDRPGAHKNLPAIRELLLAGKNSEAEALVNRTFTCRGKGSGHGRGANVPFGCYQTLGNLRVRFAGEGPVSEYRRMLDLSSAVATVEFKQGNILHTREHFVSEPDQVGVICYRADQGGQISFELGMDRPERFSTSVVEGDLLMTGTLPDAWSYGEVKRLHARGGLVVDMAWKAGKLISASVTATRGGKVVVLYAGTRKAATLAAGQAVQIL